jgi:peptidoglycan hydrolase-like amidase
VRRWLLLAFAVGALAAACSGVLRPPPAPAGNEIPAPAPAATAPAAAVVPERPAPPPAPPVEPLPQAPAPEPLSAPPLAAAAEPPSPPAPILLRVGLASDLERVRLPCCDGEAQVELAGDWTPLVAPLAVEPAAGAVEAPVFRLQVAALHDEGQARELAARLAAQTGEPADSHFDAGVGLYRVRLGRFASREAAEAARRRPPVAALAAAWVVSEGGAIEDPALAVTQGAHTVRVPGRWLAVAAGDGGLRLEGKRYRGRILVYLNDRGSLNVVNELPLEDYLRGVVPREMGPGIYDRLEALKAQAVAARTYTLRNLGEFAAEGYDICGTPRCQVYGGMDVEHPLSDRAIAETADQVLIYQGQLIDALYTSTCGGHTEDVHVVFPDKDYPYLKGVPCMEAGVERIAGGLPRGTPFPAGLTRTLLPPAVDAAPAAALSDRLEHLALLAGLPVPGDRLGSLDRREVQRFLLSLFDLALDVQLFVAAEDLPYLAADAPPGWGEEDLRRAAYLAKAHLLSGPLDRPLAAAEIEGMLERLAELLEVVRVEEVRFSSLAGGRLTVRGEEGERSFPLPERPATFRLSGDAPVAGDLTLVPGDRLRLYWRGELLLALVQEIDPEGVAYDRTSTLSSWTRFRSDARLAERVEERYPGLGFTGFEVLERGRSGRVARIRLQGRGGDSVEVAGLAIRWLFDVPETLFTARRLQPAGGTPGWLFTGKGWGHGVGLCQVGAFGMAGRGAGYRDILTHYYTGARLARVRRREEAAAPQPSPPQSSPPQPSPPQSSPPQP